MSPVTPFLLRPVAAEPLRNRSGKAERDETGRRAPRFLQASVKKTEVGRTIGKSD